MDLFILVNGIDNTTVWTIIYKYIYLFITTYEAMIWYYKINHSHLNIYNCFYKYQKYEKNVLNESYIVLRETHDDKFDLKIILENSVKIIIKFLNKIHIFFIAYSCS